LVDKLDWIDRLIVMAPTTTATQGLKGLGVGPTGNINPARMRRTAGAALHTRLEQQKLAALNAELAQAQTQTQPGRKEGKKPALKSGKAATTKPDEGPTWNLQGLRRLWAVLGDPDRPITAGGLDVQSLVLTLAVSVTVYLALLSLAVGVDLNETLIYRPVRWLLWSASWPLRFPFVLAYRLIHTFSVAFASLLTGVNPNYIPASAALPTSFFDHPIQDFDIELDLDDF
ncbi:hypothetical protein HK100_004442, partial [Physocladia obscura]